MQQGNQWGVDYSVFNQKAEEYKNSANNGNTEYYKYYLAKLEMGDNWFHILPNRKNFPMHKTYWRWSGLPPKTEKAKWGQRAQCIEKTHPNGGYKCPILEVYRELESRGIDAEFRLEQRVQFTVLLRKNTQNNGHIIHYRRRNGTESIDSSITPFVLDLPYNTALKLFHLLSQETHREFFEPNQAVLFNCIKQKDNGFTSYTFDYHGQMAGDPITGGTKLPTRVAIHQNPQAIEMILENVPNLEEIHKPVEDQLAADGRITKLARGVRQFYNLNMGTNQAFNSPNVPASNFPNTPAPPTQNFPATPPPMPPNTGTPSQVYPSYTQSTTPAYTPPQPPQSGQSGPVFHNSGNQFNNPTVPVYQPTNTSVPATTTFVPGQPPTTTQPNTPQPPSTNNPAPTTTGVPADKIEILRKNLNGPMCFGREYGKYQGNELPKMEDGSPYGNNCLNCQLATMCQYNQTENS